MNSKDLIHLNRIKEWFLKYKHCQTNNNKLNKEVILIDSVGAWKFFMIIFKISYVSDFLKVRFSNFFFFLKV